METKTGFFEVTPGNKSSSRLNSTIIIWIALLMVSILVVSISIVAIKTGNTNGMLGALTGVGAFFATVAGGAMVFMFNQKKTESTIIE